MEHHIRFDADAMTLYLLDQRALPGREDYLPIRTLDETIRALQVMVVRGAPAIGVTAGFGCVLALEELRRSLPAGADWRTAYDQALVRLEAARPTAVNLRWGVERMRALWRAHAGLEMEALIPVLLAEAETMRREDVEICREIGRHGASCINDGDTVLTHCNAGALATAGYGTALGVIRGALEAGKKVRVIADETRPFLQGARLTAWELQQDGIDVRVACDRAWCSAWWWGPTASRPTATPPTRSALSAWPCWPGISASPSMWRRPCPPSTRARPTARTSPSRSAPTGK